jgi:hypothetical protein
MDERGTWLLLIKPGPNRKKQSFGKTEEDGQGAIKATELIAEKMGLPLARQTDPQTVETLVDEWYSLNEQRWQPATKERYRGIIRDFLPPLKKVPMEQVDRLKVKRLLVDLMKIRSANMVEVVRAVISGIFRKVIDPGCTDKNPAHGLLKKIMPPKNKRNLKEPNPCNQKDLVKTLRGPKAIPGNPFRLVMQEQQ